MSLAIRRAEPWASSCKADQAAALEDLGVIAFEQEADRVRRVPTQNRPPPRPHRHSHEDRPEADEHPLRLTAGTTEPDAGPDLHDLALHMNLAVDRTSGDRRVGVVQEDDRRARLPFRPVVAADEFDLGDDRPRRVAPELHGPDPRLVPSRLPGLDNDRIAEPDGDREETLRRLGAGPGADGNGTIAVEEREGPRPRLVEVVGKAKLDVEWSILRGDQCPRRARGAWRRSSCRRTRRA